MQYSLGNPRKGRQQFVDAVILTLLLIGHKDFWTSKMSLGCHSNWPSERRTMLCLPSWVTLGYQRAPWSRIRDRRQSAEENTIILKNGGPGLVWHLCFFYHEPLRTWIKTDMNNFATWSHTALKSSAQTLRSYLKLNCEYELHIWPDTKVDAAKDHGKNFIKVRPPLVRHLLCTRLFMKNLFWLRS